MIIATGNEKFPAVQSGLEPRGSPVFFMESQSAKFHNSYLKWSRDRFAPLTSKICYNSYTVSKPKLPNSLGARSGE